MSMVNVMLAVCLSERKRFYNKAGIEEADGKIFLFVKILNLMSETVKRIMYTAGIKTSYEYCITQKLYETLFLASLEATCTDHC